MNNKFVWYFAYGNNMNPQVLEKRGVTPTKSIVAKVPGMRIAFEMISLYRPGTGDATIRYLLEQETVPEIWGVLHWIHIDNLSHLDRWEAVELGHYQRKEIKAIATSTKAVKAITYEALHLDRNLLPSRQYLDAIFAGASYFNLPTKYLSFLQEHQVYDG